jgi:isopenicillin N synthase-like dioxygenase
MVAVPQFEDSDLGKASHFPSLPNLWPENPPDFQKYMCKYNNQMRDFSMRFVRIIALALRAEETSLDHICNPFSGLSALRYPPYRKGMNDGRAVHTDYSCGFSFSLSRAWFVVK